MNRFVAILMSALLAASFAGRAKAASEEKINLTITGGHETDPRDHGRPVTLIASALGVTPEVFRNAFSRVKPAPAGTEPDPAQVQRNKAALLGELSRHGVTNELLDRVSNFYRYRPESGGLWPTTPAAAYATIKDGAVTSVVITSAGAGCNSTPRISIPGHPEIALKATIAFDRDLKKNGSISSITVEGSTNRGR
ncbi:MAG: hypothetical protein HY300_07030 [Verrucomicrobia bacterium]|nr:hypothetical protein [Verrucomicrobiota bacterium]